jgi:hypothetical protein
MGRLILGRDIDTEIMEGSGIGFAREFLPSRHRTLGYSGLVFGVGAQTVDIILWRRGCPI